MNEQYLSQVRVLSHENAKEASVAVRRQCFSVGQAIEFDSEAPLASALEYVLGALGADIVTGFKRLADRRGVAVDEVEALITGRLNNPLVYLGVVGEKGNPGLEHVSVKVFVSTFAPADTIEEVWQEVLRRSPLVCTFRRAVTLELNWKAAF
ncbi:MAG: hypothetical protein KatS3mg105_0346 [Gemmatales bacterium]|nr:MAG: hypothetical protein KatS3mg105_0346 [Gemmatales bacterium]